MLLLLLGCGEAAPDSFIAFARDFDHFRGWQSIELPWAPGIAGIHVAGKRTVYLSQRPAHGSTRFPLGTRIVKVVDQSGKIFAMAKRGGDFNATGAVGWEWFELEDRADGGVVFEWRGLGPPSGEGYFGDPNKGCNGCHQDQANDYVQEPDLKLTDF